METQLGLVSKSYDKAIDFGRRGIDLYEDLPEYITNHPDYPKFQRLKMEGSLSDSGRKEIKDYLSPDTNMKFIDLGCCLNLMFNGYDKWLSTYHGVDISSKTIQLLNEFVTKKKLPIGSLYCGSIHETPFEDSYFDIGACVGILEYFEKDFVKEAIIEAHRIIKPYGKFVLDIPNFDSPLFRITMLIEEHLGRPDKFNMSSQEFDAMLQDYFEIEKKENIAGMIQYFLVRKK
ncbi:class I SAM-dependent methyltransferase [Paenibacillus sp. D2_2]|uniref:class I SAM-dependent methyltransferase n=1 Tax=Paenibacillus sp. D2_2 TaxID=3073092 RepID=UPI002814F33F|nr:class I SAM-dependent methyltransferase [Paenibacillus sp. D2_2]WMT39695.1 class I SAM-dependent methyltransferase [Paenibacillus sp. D2_2]